MATCRRPQTARINYSTGRIPRGFRFSAPSTDHSRPTARSRRKLWLGAGTAIVRGHSAPADRTGPLPAAEPATAATTAAGAGNPPEGGRGVDPPRRDAHHPVQPFHPGPGRLRPGREGAAALQAERPLCRATLPGLRHRRPVRPLRIRHQPRRTADHRPPGRKLPASSACRSPTRSGPSGCAA